MDKLIQFDGEAQRVSQATAMALEAYESWCDVNHAHTATVVGVATAGQANGLVGVTIVVRVQQLQSISLGQRAVTTDTTPLRAIRN